MSRVKKLVEVCNLVGCITIEAYHGYNSSNDKSRKVTSVEFLTESCELITKTYEGIIDYEIALKLFVDEYYPCDRYFTTRSNFDIKSRSDKYGSFTKEVFEGNLHTVTLL